MPLFDVGFVSVARVIRGKVHSVHEWLADTDKDHIHHRFAALGLSALLLARATTRGAMVLVQAGCVFAIIALLEGVGRGRP